MSFAPNFLPKLRIAGFVVAAAVLVASCSSGIATAARQAESTQVPEVEQGNRPMEPDDPEPGTNARPYAETLQRSVIDIQQFWSQQFPEAYGADFEPIPTDRMFPYNEANPPPDCGQNVPYELLRGNAFYCAQGRFIAWDDGDLLPGLYRDFGPFAIAMVLAHEWGHAVQDQAGIFNNAGRTVVLEQQADCFAGAWTRRIADGDSPNMSLDEGSLASALSGMLSFRDEPGLVDVNGDGAHGSGFDRVRAFREGYEDGVKRCVRYPDEDLPLLSFPFTDREEVASGGNLEVDEIVEYSVSDLNEFFVQAFPSFGRIDEAVPFASANERVSCGSKAVDKKLLDVPAVYCSDDDSVLLNSELVSTVHADIGDFAVGTAAALQWALKAQVQAGYSDEELANQDSVEQRLCLVGGWAKTFVDDRERGDGTFSVPKRDFYISGGDLDEALQYIIRYSSSDAEAGTSDLAFDNVEAFQDGVLNGVESCDFTL